MTEEATIHFFCEDIDFTPENPVLIETWVLKTIQAEGKSSGPLNIVFCSDRVLKKMNTEYLNHDDFTDVITFPYSEDPVSGDIFISIDRVRENATEYNDSFANELHRVIIHGILHLLGYNDKGEHESKEMRIMENKCLALMEEIR